MYVSKVVFWDMVWTISLAIWFVVLISLPAIVKAWIPIISVIKEAWAEWKEKRQFDRRFKMIQAESEKSHEAI